LPWAEVLKKQQETIPIPRTGVALNHVIPVQGDPTVMVDTANRLQGLEFDLLVGIHPMAGLAEPDSFHLDPGRLCVMLTRHRHACILIGRASDVDLLDGVPPATPAYLGTTSDPVLDGWVTHRRVYETLLANRVQA
jgi:hypothetical protein